MLDVYPLELSSPFGKKSFGLNIILADPKILLGGGG